MSQTEFQKYVTDILEVVMFENWLRFYFIAEEANDTDLRLELPPRSKERICELYPELSALAEALDGKKVTFEISRDSVLQHIMNHLEGKTIPRGEAQRVLQSATFQTKLQLFHTWEQLHENQLESGFQEFGAWRSLFAQWLDTPGARDLAKKLLSQPG